MTTDPYPLQQPIQYVGFWARVLASLVDTVLLILLLMVLSLLTIDGFHFDPLQPSSDLMDFVINTIIPAMVVLVFWARVQATPGKMMVHARIVDAKTGADPRPMQLVIRYLGYFVSCIVFGLGFVWIAFDPRKQGLHDKMAGTVVIRDEKYEEKHDEKREADAPGLAR
jgi:uncharacterized RDD family membrane protein YckC